ncbi:hypothetical protein MRX96_007183 [Rhipicephalus microplus]
MDPKHFYGREISSDSDDSDLSRTVNAWLLYKKNAMTKPDEHIERLLPLAALKMDLATPLCKAGKMQLKM